MVVIDILSSCRLIKNLRPPPPPPQHTTSDHASSARILIIILAEVGSTARRPHKNTHPPISRPRCPCFHVFFVTMLAPRTVSLVLVTMVLGAPLSRWAYGLRGSSRRCNKSLCKQEEKQQTKDYKQ